MRLPDNGRYGYPLIRPSTFRAFLFDKTNPYDPDTCLIDGYSLAWNSSPSAINSPTGIAKIGIRTGPSTISSAEQQAMLGDSTFHIMLRIDSGLPNIFYYSNFIGNLYAETGRKLGFFTNGSFSEVETTPEAFVYGEWFLCTLRKRNTQLSSGLPLAGGTSTVELFVNGQIVGQNTSFLTGSVSGTPFLEVGDTSALAIDSFFYYAEALSDDAIAEDVRRVHQLRTHCRAGLRVTVEDQNGEYRDLTDLNGVDWVTSASITDEPDNPTMDASVTLVREQGNQSLATLVTNAELNLSNPGDVTSYIAPFLEIGRGIEIYSARVPVGIDPDGRDWFSVFKGYIDEIKEGGESIQLECRDQAAELIDAYIEEELPYADPFLSSTLVEDEMQSILDRNSGTYYTGSYVSPLLRVPVSPGWAMKPWVQRREPVMSALRTLAGQIGWDVRYKYDKTTDAWRLTFFAPERDSPRATTTLTKDDILEVTNLTRNILGIRNVVRVVYPSSETTTPTLPTYSGISATNGWNNVDGEGNRMTAYVELSDAAAIARVGRRLFMEVAEASSSQIDTINEAFDFALSMLLDLREEDLAKSITIPLMPELEVNDLPKVMPIPELFTVPQRLAVKRLTHTFDPSGATTTVEMRGKPAVGQKRWLMLDTRSGGGKPAVIDPTQAISDLTTGTLLSTMRNLLDRTNQFTGGKYLQIRNPEFSQYSAGLNSEPDGWYMVTGTWGVDADALSDSLSGDKSVIIKTSSGRLMTLDPIAIRGSEPLSVEVTWKRETGDDYVQITVSFQDINKSFISQSDIYPGSGIYGFPSVPAGTDWITSRAQGITPPSNARYMTLRVQSRQNTSPLTSILVDSIAAYRTGRGLKAGAVQTTTLPGQAASWGYANSNVGFFYNQKMSVVSISPFVSGFPFYDYGQQVIIEDASATNQRGHAFLCKEPGTYRVSFVGYVVESSTSPLNISKTTVVQIVKNGRYDGTYAYRGLRTSGTVIARNELTRTWTNNTFGHALEATVNLAENDTLTIDLNYLSGDPNGAVVIHPGATAGSGATNEYSYFMVKLSKAD